MVGLKSAAPRDFDFAVDVMAGAGESTRVYVLYFPSLPAPAVLPTLRSQGFSE